MARLPCRAAAIPQTRLVVPLPFQVKGFSAEVNRHVCSPRFGLVLDVSGGGRLSFMHDNFGTSRATSRRVGQGELMSGSPARARIQGEFRGLRDLARRVTAPISKGRETRNFSTHRDILLGGF